MRKLVITLVILFVCLTIDSLIAWRLHPEAKNPVIAMKLTGADALANILVYMVKKHDTFPKLVDNLTYLDDVRAEGSKVIYDLSFDVNNVYFIDIVNQMRQNMRETACDREDYRKMLKYGLTVVIEPHTRNGARADPISIAPKDCAGSY